MTSRERLTRQELGWLLAQEARGAAKALREGVSQLKQPGPSSEAPLPPVELTLDALDGAIELLSELEARPAGKGRRGRIDVAALLYEIAPGARIVMEPGAGTEVFGDEADLRRMLHVLLTQTTPGSTSEPGQPEVSVRREEDLVKVSVLLGPDRSATAELERRWLARMAVRLGGRLELEGAVQSLSLPADGASVQREVDALRRELEQAQQLGEAYARELAEVFASGLPSEPPSPTEGGWPERRLAFMTSMVAALERMLRPLVDGLRGDAQANQGSSANAVLCAEGSTLEPALSRRASQGQEILSELQRVLQCRWHEPPRALELGDAVRETVAAAANRAARHGVELNERIETPAPVWAHAEPLCLLVRSLLDHAIAATPLEGQVWLRVWQAGKEEWVAVEDGGPAVPPNARDDLLQHRLDPTSIGRPGGIALLVADTTAGHLGCELRVRDGAHGGTEIAFPLPRHEPLHGATTRGPSPDDRPSRDGRGSTGP